MTKVLFLLFFVNILIFIFTIFISHKWVLIFSDIPKVNYLLVLGAGIHENGQPSKILKDRLASAAKYAHKFNPKFIILSGTIKGDTYNEPLCMQSALLLEGVAQKPIRLDPSGFTTFQSCLNFKKRYGIQEVVIVSQKYHLYRAILISRIIGLHAYGLTIENYSFHKSKICFWYLREFFAIPFNMLKIILYFLQNHRTL